MESFLIKPWIHLISFISNDLFSCMVCFPKFPRVVAYFLSKIFDSCCLAQQLFRAILRVFLGHYMFYVPIQGKFTFVLMVSIIAMDFQCIYIHKRKKNNSLNWVQELLCCLIFQNFNWLLLKIFKISTGWRNRCL